MAVVADSSPLIYLAALSDFRFLPDFFGSVLIPPAVYREVVEQGHGFPLKEAVETALGDWLKRGGHSKSGACDRNLRPGTP